MDRLAPTDQLLDIRAEIEAAAQTALDTADRLIALLNGRDGNADEEPNGHDLSLGAPKGHASQVVRLRATGRALEFDR